MFNISFLWMEISLVGGVFFCSPFGGIRLATGLGNHKKKRKFQLAADAERQAARKSMPGSIKSTHLQLHNTQSLHRELSFDLIYRSLMSVGPRMRDFPSL